MWDFIKYCLHCMSIFIGTAFGENPEGATGKNLMVGFLTAAVVGIVAIAVFCCVIVIVGLIKKRFK